HAADRRGQLYESCLTLRLYQVFPKKSQELSRSPLARIQAERENQRLVSSALVREAARPLHEGSGENVGIFYMMWRVGREFGDVFSREHDCRQRVAPAIFSCGSPSRIPQQHGNPL